MTFQYADQFLRDYKTLPHPIQTKFKKRLNMLASQGVTYRGLAAKKMHGQESIWEARIDIHYRFTFQMVEDHVFLRRVGTHQIYRNP